MDAPGDEHDEHAVAAGDRPIDDLVVVGRAGHDADPAFEVRQLADALLPAYGDHLVAAIERVLDHVLPELAGRAHDADTHGDRHFMVGHDRSPRCSGEHSGGQDVARRVLLHAAAVQP